MAGSVQTMYQGALAFFPLASLTVPGLTYVVSYASGKARRR